MKTLYEWVTDCHYRISAKALIINQEGRFALSRESNGNWDFPGWGIDHGEEVHEALKREIMEETWLEIESIETLPSYFCLAESSTWEVPLWLVFYKTAVKDLKITPSDECEELRFFSFQEAQQIQLYSGTKVSILWMKNIPEII